jgi:hypothetical protein
MVAYIREYLCIRCMYVCPNVFGTKYSIEGIGCYCMGCIYLSEFGFGHTSETSVSTESGNIRMLTNWVLLAPEQELLSIVLVGFLSFFQFAMSEPWPTCKILKLYKHKQNLWRFSHVYDTNL